MSESDGWPDSDLFELPDLSRHLQTFFARIAPPDFTAETRKAVIRYLRHRRSLRAAALQPDLTSSGPGLDLTARWTAEGGSVGDLVKFLVMCEHRSRVRRSTFSAGTQEPDPFVELETFWVTSGHDLTELGQFLSELDLEAGDWLPK
jgi:hypothetical protein